MTTTTIDIKQLAKEVATALGPDWYVSGNPYPTSATIGNKKEDEQFGIGLWVHDGKLTIKGRYVTAKDSTIYPRHHLYPSINVGMNKSPQQIARDISRRLLQEYRDIFAKAVISREEASQYLDGQQSNLARMAKLLNGTIQGECINGGPSQGRNIGYLAKCQVGSTVTLEIRSLPIDVAERLIKEWTRE